MAIDRKDYQYIHNTLEKKSIASNDNTVKVGSKVKNLLVELNEENIWNGDFQDYYGSRPSQCWEPYSIKGETIETVISKTEGDKPGYNEHWTITKERVAFVIPGSSGNNIGIVGPDGSISSVKYVTYYKLEYYYTFPNGGNKQNITDIVVENVINSQSYNSASYKWAENVDNVIICYFYSTSPTVQGILRYIVKESSREDKTVESGILYYTTSIKPETSYVLQVINAVSPSDISTEKRNQIILTNSKDESRYINFDQYLFFETGTDEVKIKLSIEGLSFGYQIYGLNGVGENADIYELRCFKTTTQAKVFLFESKHPWTLDNNGIITGLTETYLNVPQKSSKTPVEGSFSTENLENLFKETPSIYIDGSKLIIPFPNSVLENGGWKWRTEVLWKYVGKNANYPKIMDNIYLLVYRNYLTDENRDYNDTQITTQYGLLRTIQKTSTSSKDPYTQDINYSIQLNQKLLSGISPKSVKQSDNTFAWNFSPISFNIEPIIVDNSQQETIIINKKTDIDWYILPLLGYNYTYSVINNKKDIYKYTSFSFAWGKKDNGKFIRLSDFSTPIIVDRSIMKIANYNNNTQYSLTPKNWDLLKWIETDATEYYPFKAIYLTTENINNIVNE